MSDSQSKFNIILVSISCFQFINEIQVFEISLKSETTSIEPVKISQTSLQNNVKKVTVPFGTVFYCSMSLYLNLLKKCVLVEAEVDKT